MQQHYEPRTAHEEGRSPEGCPGLPNDRPSKPFEVAWRDALDEPHAVLREVEVAATVTNGAAVRLVTIVYQSWRPPPVRFSVAAAWEMGAAARKRTVPMCLTGVLRGV